MPLHFFSENCDLYIRPWTWQITLNLLETEMSCHNVKYEGPNSYQSKDMANVEVFADKQTYKRINGQTNIWTGECNTIVSAYTVYRHLQ